MCQAFSPLYITLTNRHRTTLHHQPDKITLPSCRFYLSVAESFGTTPNAFIRTQSALQSEHLLHVNALNILCHKHLNRVVASFLQLIYSKSIPIVNAVRHQPATLSCNLSATNSKGVVSTHPLDMLSFWQSLHHTFSMSYTDGVI